MSDYTPLPQGETCHSCGGSGRRKYKVGELQVCPNCSGSGMVPIGSSMGLEPPNVEMKAPEVNIYEKESDRAFMQRMVSKIADPKRVNTEVLIGHNVKIDFADGSKFEDGKYNMQRSAGPGSAAGKMVRRFVEPTEILQVGVSRALMLSFLHDLGFSAPNPKDSILVTLPGAGGHKVTIFNSEDL